jgi:hypothetical protein
VRVEAIGTAANGPASGKTLVRLTGAYGSSVLSLDWVRGLVVNIEFVPNGALEIQFVPVGPRRVARFDLWAELTTFVDRPS